MRFGRNAECPCGSGLKYKKCCKDRVDWETIYNRGSVVDATTHMTARGKNRLFATKIADILQLDNLPSPREWTDIKRAMTPRAVREIHEAIALVWPSEADLRRVLRAESSAQNALFLGSYQPEAVLRGLARHALYSETILVIDPLLYPSATANRFNPVLNPESHRSNTLVALRMMMLLGPWIDAGIVRMIRTPGDFDHDLAAATLQAAHDRFKKTPELAKIAENEATATAENMQEYKDYYFLSLPDFKIEAVARENNPAITQNEIREILAAVHEARERHPFYVDPPIGPDHPGSFISFSAGTNYEMAKVVAAETRSHLVTDMRYRWKEIEIDDRHAGIDPQRWSAFAKAFGAAKLRYLDMADLELAVRLRGERRLEDLRLFFRKLWNEVSGEEAFDDSRATDLASELSDRINDAEEAWRTIDVDLVKWFGAEVTAAGAIAAGHGQLKPAMVGTAIGGAATLVYSWLQRRNFKHTHPAAFFIGQ